MKLKFGIFTMPEHYPWDNWTLAYERDLDEIVYAEKLGFDEFWIGEHHSGGYENIPVPEYLIAKASAVTSRIKLGTGVISLPFHDPFLVAERLAFLDHLTYGRLLYGFGGGGLPTDWDLFEIPAEELRPRMNEALEIIKALYENDEPISYEGKFWRYKNRRLQVRPYQEKPPIAIAGLTGLNSYELAGRNNWIPMSIYFTPIRFKNNSQFADLLDQAAALDRAAREAGHDPAELRKQWRVVREVYVADSREQAMEDIRKGVKQSYDYLLGVGLGPLMKLDENMPDSEITFEWMVENIPWIVGSPDDCIKQIKNLYDQLGGFGVFVINSRDWVTTDKWKRSLELFARYVIPAFR